MISCSGYTEQSDLDKCYVEGTTRDARESWFGMVEVEKRGKTERAVGGNSHSPRDERT